MKFFFSQPEKGQIVLRSNIDSRLQQLSIGKTSIGLFTIYTGKLVGLRFGQMVTKSAYHLNGILGGFFWTNGTARFLTKKTERIEPYHLIRSFGCKCFPAPLTSKARIMKAKVKHKKKEYLERYYLFSENIPPE